MFVQSISLQPVIGFSNNIAQLFITLRECAEFDSDNLVQGLGHVLSGMWRDSCFCWKLNCENSNSEVQGWVCVIRMWIGYSEQKKKTWRKMLLIDESSLVYCFVLTEMLNWKFDRKDLLVIVMCGGVGLWYLIQKVCSPFHLYLTQLIMTPKLEASPLVFVGKLVSLCKTDWETNCLYCFWQRTVISVLIHLVSIQCRCSWQYINTAVFTVCIVMYPST